VKRAFRLGVGEEFQEFCSINIIAPDACRGGRRRTNNFTNRCPHHQASYWRTNFLDLICQADPLEQTRGVGKDGNPRANLAQLAGLLKNRYAQSARAGPAQPSSRRFHRRRWRFEVFQTPPSPVGTLPNSRSLLNTGMRSCWWRAFPLRVRIEHLSITYASDTIAEVSVSSTRSEERFNGSQQEYIRDSQAYRTCAYP
jgi:hypothetical protein